MLTAAPSRGFVIARASECLGGLGHAKAQQAKQETDIFWSSPSKFRRPGRCREGARKVAERGQERGQQESRMPAWRRGLEEGDNDNRGQEGAKKPGTSNDV